MRIRVSLPILTILLLAVFVIAGAVPVEAAPAEQSTVTIIVLGFVDVVGGNDPACPGCNGEFDPGDQDEAERNPLPAFSVTVRDSSGTEVARETTMPLAGLQRVSISVPEDSEFELTIDDPGGWVLCPNESRTRTLTAGDFQLGNALEEFHFWQGCDNQPETSVRFWADNTEIDQGDCTQLRWETKNVKSVTLDGESVPLIGDRRVCPDDDTTYTLRVVHNDDRVETKTVTIRVSTPGVKYWADEYEIERGSCTTLRWEIDPEARTELDGQSVDGRDGTKDVCPDVDTTYTLRVWHETEPTVKSITIKVVEPGEGDKDKDDDQGTDEGAAPPPTGGLGSIRGLAFIDENEDGMLGPEEPGINNVGVYLHGGNTQLSQGTNGAGQFSFDGLAEGQFDVYIDPGSDWRVTTTDRYTGVQVVGSEAVMGIDFGLVRINGTSAHDDLVVPPPGGGIRLPDTGIADMSPNRVVMVMALLLAGLALFGFSSERLNRRR